MDTPVQKGKQQILFIISFLLGVSLFYLGSYMLYSYNVGFTMIVSETVEFSIYAFFSYMLYKGHDWARITLAVLMVVASAGGLLRPIEAAIVGIPVSFWLISITIISLVYGALAILLFNSKYIKAFFEYKAQEHKAL